MDDVLTMSSAIHKRHTIDELRTLIAPVAERYGVGKVYLFGSVASPSLTLTLDPLS